MSKYTAGPWAVKQVPTSVGVAFKVNEPEHLDDEHGLIACIYSDDTSMNLRPRTEHAANAHLIAAAPELLAALKCVLNTCEMTAELEQRINEAIAKAEQS